MFKLIASVLLVVIQVIVPANTYAQDNARQPGRDPTRPLGYQLVAGKTSVVKEAELKLSSVLISAQRKLAIINGQSLREGQTIPGTQGVVLVGIYPRGVTVAQGERRWELKMAPSVIKKN